CQLGAKRRKVGRRIWCGEIDDEKQRAAPFDVTEEPVAEASPFGGALDQARDVGDHEPTVASEDAEVRRERGERIVRDLGPRGGQRAEERRLAGVRKPDETEVRDGVELELEGTLLALLAGLRHPGDAVLRPGEPCVPSSAAPASGAARARYLSDEVGDRVVV